MEMNEKKDILDWYQVDITDSDLTWNDILSAVHELRISDIIIDRSDRLMLYYKVD